MRYKVECLGCWTKYHVEGLRPRYCAECGTELTEGCVSEQLTPAGLAKVPYDVPEGTPNIHDVKDAWELRDLTGIGYTKSRKIWMAIHERKMVFEKPVDLLKVGGIGVPTVAKLIGKVAFGLPEMKGWVVCPHCGEKTKVLKGVCLMCNRRVER